MLSLSIGMTALGYYCCYITSKRALLPKTNPLVTWAQSNAKTSNYLGLLLQTLGLLLCILSLGFGSGLFSFLVILMTVASAILLIGPLYLINSKHLVLLFIVALALELYI